MSITSWILQKMTVRAVSWSFRKIFGRKDLVIFEKLLESPERWKKVSYNSPEKWIFEGDNSFVIEVSSKSRDFTENWTERFPDKGSSAVQVLLKINGERVHTPLLFVGVDGWRYFVPCPKRDEAYDEQYYYWDSDSLEYKVFRVIGKVDYLFNNLEEFGKACGVKFR